MQQLQQEDLLRYSRQIPVIGLEGQQRLKNAKILCVGSGGLGCPVLQYLAACGVGTLGIMDPDKIELSNLQRQILFGEQDVGRNKAQVAGERLRSLTAAVNLEIYEEFLSEQNAKERVEGFDVVIDASDNYPTRYLLNTVCRALGKPLVSASIYQFEAQVSVFNVDGGPCYQCLYPEPPPEHLSPNCSLSGVLGILPGVAGCLQAIEAVKLIIGKEDVLSGTLLSMDLLTMQFKRFDIPKHDCNQHPVVHFKQKQHCSTVTTSVIEITAANLDELLKNNSDAVQLLDVREVFERKLCHIGGVHIPLSLFDDETVKNLLHPNKPIVVYCKSGARSTNAAQRLHHLGFQNIRNLRGGILDWIKTVDNTLMSY